MTNAFTWKMEVKWIVNGLRGAELDIVGIWGAMDIWNGRLNSSDDHASEYPHFRNLIGLVCAQIFAIAV